MGHSMIVPDEALEGLRDAVNLFEKKADLKIVQTKFIEYLFAGSDPEMIADIVWENYKKKHLGNKIV